MSGHSHWSSIRHQKAITDKKRGKVFSKISQIISNAVKEKGSNPQINFSLRVAIEKARSLNMPNDKIEKAIKRGAGGLQEIQSEKIFFEGYGPGKIAIIIECITDNKNRTLGEIKQALIQTDGKLASINSVQWLFERKGVLILEIVKSNKLGQKDKEILELKIIEAGADDFQWREENIIELYAKYENLEKVKKKLKDQNIKIKETSLDWLAKEKIKLSEENQKKCKKLFEALGKIKAVQKVYSNLKTEN